MSVQPNTKHAVGASRGVGGIFPLPFTHLHNPGRGGYYYIPKDAPTNGRGVLLAFHGLGDYGRDAVSMWKAAADAHKIAIVAPDSNDRAWDVGKAGSVSEDMQHAADCLYWLRMHGGKTDASRFATIGHSYGCRMAAYFATNVEGFSKVAVSHGRFVPESLGKQRVAAWLSGSPKDNEFSFAALKDLAPHWPNGPHELHAFDCASCFHAPQAQEVHDIGNWLAGD